MKTINKVIALGAIMLSTLMFMPKAQGQMFQIGAHIGGGVPIGDAGDIFGFGFSYTAFANYYFDDLEELSVGLELQSSIYGYDDGFNSIGGITGTQTFYNVMLNGQWHFIEADDDFDVFAGVGVGISSGAGLSVGSFSFSDSTSAPTYNDTYLVLTPRVGASIELDGPWRIDGNVGFTYMAAPEFTEIEPFSGNQRTIDPADFTTININLGVTYFLMD